MMELVELGLVHAPRLIQTMISGDGETVEKRTEHVDVEGGGRKS